MRVYFASDHAGYDLKQRLIGFVADLGYDVEDLGPDGYDGDDDYPDFIMPLARRVAAEEGSFGIVIGASGQGEAMAANRVRGARAAVYYAVPHQEQTDADGEVLDLLTSTRAHNDANILSLGARFLLPEEAEEAVRQWLKTPFSEEPRHVRRIQKLDA